MPKNLGLNLFTPCKVEIARVFNISSRRLIGIIEEEFETEKEYFFLKRKKKINFLQ